MMLFSNNIFFHYLNYNPEWLGRGDYFNMFQGIEACAKWELKLCFRELGCPDTNGCSSSRRVGSSRWQDP